MPIFDNELIDNLRKDGSLEGPDPVLGSSPGTKLDLGAISTGGASLFGPVKNREFSLNELREIKGGPQRGFAQPFASASTAELLANKRYPVYERGVDLENIYGLQQPWYQQLGNGVAKLGVNTVGTFAQSLTNIPNTISAIKDTDFAKLSGDPNGYEGTIDNWMRNMDDVLPNYMTRYERDHPYSTAIPFTRGSANWWGGKFLPNLGFMGGAVLGAVVQDVAIGAVTEGIGAIPLVASQIGKASLYLNKLFTGTNAAERVAKLAVDLGKTESQILNMTKLAQLSAAAKVGSGFRYGMSIYGSAMTEAGVESRDAYRQVKEELTKQYIADNGTEPDFAASEEIENYATNAMNTRFGVNMALLTASNTLQFGNLFKSITAAKGATQQLGDIGKIGLAEGSLDVFEKKAAKTIAGKVWESVKPGVGNIFREGVLEEGAQFAAERATYDYFTRKYNGDKETWQDLNEVIKSTTFGMKEQFGSQEGIENMLIGGLTGLLVGKVQNIYENKKGISKDKKLASALNIVNRFGITNTLQRQYDSTATQASIAKDMQEAAKTGDVFKYKNYQEDAFFDFVSYRLPSGMHDVTIMQLDMLKDLPKEQFEQMFQLDFNETNKATVNNYVDALIDRANEIKKTSDAIENVFRNPFKNNPKEGDIESQVEADNHQTFENYKLDLGYYASIAPNVNRRINSIQQDINDIAPGVSTDLVAQLTNADSIKELSDLYEEKANQLNSTITEFTSVKDKIDIKNQVKALRTRSERIARALGDNNVSSIFKDLLNFELNGQDATKDDVVSAVQIDKLIGYGIDTNKLLERKKTASIAYDKLATKEGFEKYFEQAEEIAADKEKDAEDLEKEKEPVVTPTGEKKPNTYINKAGVEEPIEVNREYQLPKAKVASLKKIADDRWRVSYPGGVEQYYKTKEDADLALADLNDELGNLQKVKVLGINDDGSIKVENLKGDIFNIQPSRIKGYEKVESKEEKFGKVAGDINRQQDELEKQNGGINVGNTSTTASEKTEKEGKLKSAKKFFVSGITESEDVADPTQSSPHIIRSRVFLNNAKNFKNRQKLASIVVTPNQLAELGLGGLVQTSYDLPVTSDIANIPDINNTDLGFVAQVFVEVDGSKIYFVDEKGERISELNGKPTDLNRVVFQNMPTTSLYYNFKDKNGNPVPRYKEGEKEIFQAYANSWGSLRAQLFKSPAFPIKPYKFTISRGLARINKIGDKYERSAVGSVIIPENKIANQQGLIVINTEGSIVHQGEIIGWPVGNPAIQYGDTLEYINNTKLGRNKATTIYQVFKALSEDVMKQFESGKKVKLPAAYMSYLQNVLYFKKGAKAGSNQFYIDAATMSLSIGDKFYKLDDIANKQNEIVEQLRDLYHNLNSFTLKDKFYSPFYEYMYENGQLSEIQWENYQAYLLKSKYPDGKTRSVEETPFLTNVAKPTAAVPYSFKQKYATLIDFELPPIEMPKPPVAPAAPTPPPSAPTGAPMIGEFEMDGETVHTYKKFEAGPIEFTGTIDKEGKPNVIVQANDTVKEAAKNQKLVNDTIIPKLKEFVNKEGKSAYDPSADDVELVSKYVAYILAFELEKLQQPAAPPPVVTPAPTAPVSEEPKPTEGYQAPSDPYMRIGVNEDDVPMTDAELEAFKQFHAEKVPGIPFEVLDNVVVTYDNEKAFGVFENGVAKFYKLAPATAPYHELGEGIWKAFLTPEQRQLILDDERARSGQFTDRASKKKIYYADATDLQLKERIWDDYAEFRAGKIKAKSLGQRVLAFFKSIMEFFKSFVQKPSMKEQLFKAIEAGKFKDVKVSDRVKRDAPEYMRIPGLTETAAYEFVQDMTIRAGQEIFGKSKKSIYQLQKVSGEEVFNKIEQLYIKENKRNQWSDATWEMLKQRTRQKLRTMGVSFNEEDKVNINDADTSGAAYAPEAFSVDWKKNSPFPVKFLASILPQTLPTNQEWSTSTKLPQRDISKQALGYKLVNASRVFATLFNKLANTTNPRAMGKKLADIAKEDADLVRFFQYMGGNIATGEIDFGKFEYEDWRLYINFFQTFSLQKPEALIQYVNGSEVYTAPANQYTLAKEILNGWYEKIKTLSKNPKSLIVYDRPSKSYKVKPINPKDPKDPNAYPKERPKLIDDQINFLLRIGVNFGEANYFKLDGEGQGKFADAVGNIHFYLQKTGNIGTISGKTLGIESQLLTLANLLIQASNPIQDSTFPGVDGKRVQSSTQNNVPSVFENEFNSANTLEELIQIRPQLQDVFSKNSVVLMNNGLFYNSDGERKKEIKVSYIQGEKINETNVGTTTSKLTLGRRLAQELNQNLDGRYYILIPADSSTEWMLNLGNYIIYEDVTSGRAWNKMYTVFNGYLEDDIALALDWEKRSILKNVGDKAKELRFFKEILSTFDKDGNLVPSEVLKGINERIEEGKSLDDIKEYIKEKGNQEEINRMIKIAVDDIIARSKEALMGNGQLKVVDEGYSFPRLESKFVTKKDVGLNKFKLSEEEVNDILTFAKMNYMIANMEFHKILIGDPYQFKIKDGRLDETKRVKSLLSPRRVTFNDPQFNSDLNDEYNKVGDIELVPGEIGYHLHKDHLNTVTIKDVEFSSSNYDKVNEADADSWLMDGAYREAKLKNGQWSPETEEWYQWHMAYTRQNLPGYQYKNTALEAIDKETLKKPEPKFVIEKFKPIATGTKAASTNIDLVVDKFAQLPIFYKAVQRRNLEKLYIKMFNENIDYVVMVSGRKVGAQELQSFYNAQNEFNDTPYTKDSIVEVPWKAWGIQVENAYENPKDQTWGSQPAKISSMDMFENGVEVIPGAKEAYDKYTEATKNYHQNKYNQLLKKLGIRDLGNGFELVDKKAIAETLEGELFRRQLPQNAIDTIELDENGEWRIPFESSTEYKKIKDILYSMINKSLVSPKLNGGPKAMSSVTLWEKGKRDPNAPNPELKFYTKDDMYCEVYLPYKFRNKFNKRRFPTDESILAYLNSSAEGKQILQGVAFRIPTDALNKIETYRIKGFLPEFMEGIAIVPSELTTKAGLDFDFDKLNTYLKSVYTDAKGNVRLVKYLGSEEATKEHFSKVFDARLEKQKVSKAEIVDALQILDLGLDDPNDLVDKYSELLDVLLEDSEIEDRADVLVQQLEKLGDKNFQAAMKEKYVDDMYNRSLENEYFQTMENMLTLPGIFDILISPTDDAGLKAESEEINKLKGVDERSIKNRLLDSTYMSTLRHFFITGKRWVGIAATNITSHSLFQKTQVYADPAKVRKLSEFDKRILGATKEGDINIILPHNKVKINGNDYLSLSGTKTADGKNQYISARLSGWATSVVDVANDPYIMDIIDSELLIGVAMFMERMGAGVYVSKFLNQPIIKEYISYLESIGAKGLFTEKNIDYIKSRFSNMIKPGDSAGITFDVSKLDENIQLYHSNGNQMPTGEKDAEQEAILNEFLKYAKLATFSFKFSQSISYDTAKSRNSDSFSRKQTRTAIANQYNVFSSPKKVLDSSFIGNQRDLLDFAMSAMGSVFKLKSDKFAIVTDSVIDPYELDEYMTEDEFETVTSKADASFLDYIIQIKSKLNNELAELTLGENSVANQLEEAKIKYPNLQLLNDLQVVTSDLEGGAATIKFRVKPKDATDIDLYTEMFRELSEIDPVLFDNIVKLSIVQGSYQGATSIKPAIPVEEYSKRIKPIIDTLVADEDVQAFAKIGSFQRNNWKDDLVMPPVNIIKTFKEDETVQPSEDQYGNIYEKHESFLFPEVNNLGVTQMSRKILTLSPKYNSGDVIYDYIKIPRIVKDPDSDFMVDVVTGMSVPIAAYNSRKASGDKTINEVLGYKKVKDGFGKPVTTHKGAYVYKLINLWGDGELASEHYTDNRKSIYNNNTKQIDEVPDGDIINHYGPVVKAENKAIAPQQAPVAQPTSGIKPVIDLSREWAGDLKTRLVYTAEGVNTMRTETAKPNEHFGNPFSEAGYGDTIKVASIGEAVVAYKEWLLGTNHQDVKPQQRAWILNQINQGKLDGATLLYAGKSAARGQGMHPTALAEVVDQLRGKQSSKTQTDDLETTVRDLGLEPQEYEIITMNGRRQIVNKTFVPQRIKKGFSKFYSKINYGLAERYGKKIVIPGFEDIELMMEQDTNDVYEMSTGLNVPTKSLTQKAKKAEVEELFKTKDIRGILASVEKLGDSSEFDKITEFSADRRREIIINFATKHKMTEEQAKNYINSALQKDRENTIAKLKECY